MDDWLTTSAAAAYLGVSRSTLYAMVARREIPHWRRPTRFRRADLDAWLEQQRVGEAVQRVAETTYRARYF